MSGNRSAPKNRVLAQRHREAQVKRRLGIYTLTSAERRKLLKYTEKRMKEEGCQHLVVINRQVPHPRYGDRVPYFESAEVPDPLQCSCEEAQRFRASLGS